MNIEEWLQEFQVGTEFLPPLVVRKNTHLGGIGQADSILELGLPQEVSSFRFVVEAKKQSTPQAIQQAMQQARVYAAPDSLPMIAVPYLSPEALKVLEQENVSGVDMNGNGIMIVPGRLYIRSTGNPNGYPDSRPLNNPYAGRSAMVARMLLMNRNWPTLNALHTAIRDAGLDLSLSQTSKAVAALTEDAIAYKDKDAIGLLDGERLMEKLGAAWKKHTYGRRHGIRLPQSVDWAKILAKVPDIKWAVTGASSVQRYAIFSQVGPKQIAVSRLKPVLEKIGGKAEPVPHFADLEFLETEEPGFYFQNEVDEYGTRWASRLQTWLELQAGDARQQDASRDIRRFMR